jgi:hypothetical protein
MEQSVNITEERIRKLDKDMNFLRMVMSTMQERVHGELRHLDGAIDMDRKRLDAIEAKLKALGDTPANTSYDEAGGEAGWVKENLRQANKRLMDDWDEEHLQYYSEARWLRQLSCKLFSLLREALVYVNGAQDDILTRGGTSDVPSQLAEKIKLALEMCGGYSGVKQ